MIKEIKEVAKSKKLIEYETVVTLHDGEHTFLSSRFPLDDTTGKVYGVCSMATDITDRKNAENEIKTINEELKLIKKQLENKNKDITDSINYAKNTTSNASAPQSYLEGIPKLFCII